MRAVSTNQIADILHFNDKNTYHSSRNRPRKKSRGHICVTLSSEMFKVACITNKKAASIPASWG